MRVSEKINYAINFSNFMTLFSECITSMDCPDGGKNFICAANKCECPNPKFLSGDKCVGTLKFNMSESFQLRYYVYDPVPQKVLRNNKSKIKV